MKFKGFKEGIAMRCVRRAAILAMIALMAVETSAVAKESSLTPPAPGITYTQGRIEFSRAILVCMGSRFAHETIKDRPEGTLDLAPASEADRKWAGSNVSSETPVWVSQKLGHLLIIIEPSPYQCEVHAIQLPVDLTFEEVNGVMKNAFAKFTQIPMKPRYTPPGYKAFAYQFEYIQDSIRYVLHMEGAQPIISDHQSPSMLYGVVIVQSETDAPPFR